MDFVRDPEVDAIVCARGGYGCHRIIHRARRRRPFARPRSRWSDTATSRRCCCGSASSAGLLGIHGPMLEKQGSLDGETGSALVRALQGTGPLPRYRGRGRGWRDGERGGSSAARSRSVVASLGTPWEIDTRGAILMLEDVTELPYRIDRMLQQLRAAGKFERAAGIALGAFTDCDDERYPECTARSPLRRGVRRPRAFRWWPSCPSATAPRTCRGPSQAAPRSTGRVVSSRYWNRR